MKNPSTSMGQLVLNLYQEIHEISLMEFVETMFIKKFKEALAYAQQLRFKSIESLRNNIDGFLLWFFNLQE